MRKIFELGGGGGDDDLSVKVFTETVRRWRKNLFTGTDSTTDATKSGRQAM